MSHVLRNWEGGSSVPLPPLTLFSAVPVKEHRNQTLLKPGAQGKPLLSVWSELLIGMVGPKQNVALTIQGIIFPIAVTQSLYQWEGTEQMRTYKMNSAVTRESDINVLFGLLVSVRTL